MNAHPLPPQWTGLPRDLRDAVLTKLLARRRGEGPADAPPTLLRADRTATLPASLEQAYFLERQHRFKGRVAWTIAAPPIILDSVDVAAVTRAVTALARRHDMLHATFRPGGDGEGAGRPTLVLDPDRPVPLTLTTLPLTAALTGAEGWVRRRYDAMLAEPFDPWTGPLWRAELVSRAGRGVILMTFCSLLVDGESLAILDADLRALYAAARAGAPLDETPPAFGYADYALTQDRLKAAGRFDGPLAWWRTRLAGGPPAAWADGRPGIGQALLYEQVLAPETGRALDAFAAAHRTTAPVVLLTLFMDLLARLDRTGDVWVAAATGARPLKGTETMVGPFAREVVLRSAWPPAGDPLSAVRALFAETMEQDPVPHALVHAMVEAEAPDAPSPFRYIFNHRIVGDGSEEGETRDVAFRTGPASATADREEDILLMVLQSGARRRIHWYLRTDRFPRESAERMLAAYLGALRDRLASG